MGIDWQARKQAVDRYTPEIKAYLAAAFIIESPVRIDENEATDLMVFDVRPYRVGCRVRDFWYWKSERFRNQFTVRSSLQSGSKTELSKILDGWGDFMFYAFADQASIHIHAAVLLDLRVFRASVELPQIQYTIETNKDGKSSFHAYQIASFPPELVRSKWIRLPSQVNIPVETHA